MKKIGGLVFMLLILMVNAQEFKIQQEDDDILFFNESKQTVEVWVRMQKIAINQIVPPGVLKKFDNPEYLKNDDLTDSEIYYAYTYRALEFDVKASLADFYKNLEENRKYLNRGLAVVNKPFYRTESFEEFLNSEGLIQIKTLNAKDLEAFVNANVLPESKDLLGNVNKEAAKSKENLVNEVSKFLATQMRDEGEVDMFSQQMSKLEYLFSNYLNSNNQQVSLGSLEENEFKIFTKNPGTDVGVYITTNNLKLIRDYNYREMDTRGLNFEVQASQRLLETRVSKRRTLNYYAAASYLSLKDKEFDLKKSFINLGPQIRYTGYYENQVQLIGSAGVTMDITSNKHMNPDDKKQFGFYAGGEISLLIFRFGLRYYTNLTEPELSPEGNLFYRLGIVAKF